MVVVRNLLYFLDSFVVVIKGGTKGSNGLINHGSSSSFNHGNAGTML